MPIAFVILHYKTFDVTVECLSHLLYVASGNPIVVVDNGSGDGSGDKIREMFGGSGVHVVSNDENLGFAKGNNAGYKFVKDNFYVDGVVVMNNDVIVDQPDFVSIVQSFMKANGVDVCGPDIITPGGRHQNPLMADAPSTPRLLKQLAIDGARLAMLKLHIFEKKILSTYTAVSDALHRDDIHVGDVEDCVLHGSCVIYSSNYLSNEDFAFVPVTFLYGEELLSYDYCKVRGYKTAICSAAKVTHLGGATTTMKGALTREKQIFVTAQMLKSKWQAVKLRLFPYTGQS